MKNKNNSLTNQISILDEVIESLKHYKQELKEQSVYVREDITESNLRGFFMKFNVAALDSFDTIFKYTKQDNMFNIKRIKNEVRQLTYMKENLKSKSYKKTFSIAEIDKNISYLNNNELEILHTFISEAAINLDIIINWPESHELKDDELDIENAPFEEICDFLDSIELEQENRKNNKNTYIKKYKGVK